MCVEGNSAFLLLKLMVKCCKACVCNQYLAGIYDVQRSLYLNYWDVVTKKGTPLLPSQSLQSTSVVGHLIKVAIHFYECYSKGSIRGHKSPLKQGIFNIIKTIQNSPMYLSDAVDPRMQQTSYSLAGATIQFSLSLMQRFSTFLMPQPFYTVFRIIVTPNHKTISWQLDKHNFYTVMDCNVNI